MPPTMSPIESPIESDSPRTPLHKRVCLNPDTDGTPQSSPSPGQPGAPPLATPERAPRGLPKDTTAPHEMWKLIKFFWGDITPEQQELATQVIMQIVMMPQDEPSCCEFYMANTQLEIDQGYGLRVGLEFEEGFPNLFGDDLKFQSLWHTSVMNNFHRPSPVPSEGRYHPPEIVFGRNDQQEFADEGVETDVSTQAGDVSVIESFDFFRQCLEQAKLMLKNF